ncbi:hypothetical protein XENORESO_001366 [Xenotaenia resolanae]|uniref:Ig-like domain-containing protein n=1 Tax=Xenotaenia resolanae TaxID=208358 RepID=A0ABV0W668_9TELE
MLFFIYLSDTGVFCQFSRTCILPCSFPVGNEVVIHWIKQLPEKAQVHSYYHNSDQLGLQSLVFKDRTLLYHAQIPNGNASLQLSNVVVQDEGRYQCYTSTINGNKETFIQLRVYAPVEKVTIEKLGDKINCHSEEIYPRPTVTWNTKSPVTPQEDSSVTTKKLFNISSFILLSADYPDETHSCTISSTRNKRTATLSKQAQRNSSGTEATIECQALDTPLNHLIWRFNYSQLILTWNKAESSYRASVEWEKHVEDVDQGSLRLKDLTSQHEGTYTCESSNAEETGIASTVLHITKDGDQKTAGIGTGIGIAVGVILLIAIVAGVIFIQMGRRKNKTHNPVPSDPPRGDISLNSQTTKAAET